MQFTKKLFFLIGVAVFIVSFFGIFIEYCSEDRLVKLNCPGDPTDDLLCTEVLQGTCTSIYDVLTDNIDSPRTACEIHYSNFKSTLRYDLDNLRNFENGVLDQLPLPTTYYYNPWCKNIYNTSQTCFDVMNNDSTLYTAYTENSYECTEEISDEEAELIKDYAHRLRGPLDNPTFENMAKHLGLS